MPYQHQAPASASPLESLATQFTQWRAARASRRTPVPLVLRQQTLALLGSQPKSHIIKALGINHSMLKNWQTQASEPSPANHFIPCPTEVAALAPALAFTVTASHGATLTITGDFSPAQLAAFAQGLCAAQPREVPSS